MSTGLTTSLSATGGAFVLLAGPNGRPDPTNSLPPKAICHRHYSRIRCNPNYEGDQLDAEMRDNARCLYSGSPLTGTRPTTHFLSIADIQVV